MTARKLFLAALAGLAILSGAVASLLSRSASQAPAASGPQASLYRVIVGAYRLVPGNIETTVSAADDGIQEVRGWMGAVVVKADSGTWRVRMHIPASPPPTASMGNLGGRRNDGPIPGFLISLAEDFPGPVQIDTPRGNVAFRPPEVSFENPKSYLDGFVRIEKVPPAIPLAATAADEDYPAIASSPDGGIWAAWVSFVGNGEHLILARVDAAGRSQPLEVTQGLTEVFRPQVAVDGSGRVWVVWSELRDGNWDLYARARYHNRWSDVYRLTENPGPDIYASLTADRSGTLWLAWQGVPKNARTSDIFLTSCRNGKWASDPIVIGSHPADDWRPSLAADSRGNIYIAWDSYRDGTYDVFVSRYDGNRVSEPRRLTGGDRFHARPSLAVDRQDRLWIAWEEGGTRWGQDKTQTSGGLHQERRVRIRCLTGDRLYLPSQTLEQAQTPWTGAMTEGVRLQVDRQGRLWAFYRINYVQRLWQGAAMYYQGGRWSEPVILDRSFGRQSVNFSTVIASDGKLWVAYAGDDRTEKEPFHATRDNVYLARLPDPAGAVSELALGGEDAVPAALSRPYARTWPQHQIQLGGRTYRLVWGELHRHTDIDHHGRPDGSLEDAYRYARDAAGLDFFATTDHILPSPNDSGINPMTWWRSQKFADLHRVPGIFEPLYAYESSKRGPQGHRNVVFPRRGGTLFGGIQGPTVNDPRMLWNALRNGSAPAIAIPHQLTDSGVDWSLYDPDFTPVMELYQSRRQSYEYDGSPQPRGVEQIWGKKAGSWAWDALAKGYKIGFIASSDHMSSHMAYAAAYTEDLSREGVFRAFTERHTYAASDNIILDFRLVDGDRQYLMGDEAQVGTIPHFRIQVIGTGPVATVEVIRNGKFVFTRKPEKERVNLDFVDNQPLSGEAYYYVRVRQQDEQMAWSSPIWVRTR